jgi:tight adherence protein B
MHGTFLLLFSAAVAVTAWLIAQAVFSLLQRKRDRLTQRLSAGTRTDGPTTYRPIVLPKGDDTVRELLARRNLIGSFTRKLGRAYPDVTLASFLIVEAIVALGTFTLIAFVTRSVVLAAIAAGSAALLPVAVVKSRHAKRQRACDDQLPEALDFLARILRAGHSLGTALQMAGEELPDPLALEFRRCYDAHSLGRPLESAMREAADRIDTTDFAFFVTAVLIQRQTGGDLAEVLTNLAAMSRSRIRMRQHVKAITAEGRLVGNVLLALPFVFFLVLYAINPKYASVLLTTELGRTLLLAAVVMQVLGVLTIRMIVNVKL